MRNNSLLPFAALRAKGYLLATRFNVLAIASKIK